MSVGAINQEGNSKMMGRQFLKATKVFLWILAAMCLASLFGCNMVGMLPLGATATPTLTITPSSTPTATPRPTWTPLPIATPTATPASIGDAVRNNELEITLLGEKNLESVHFGDVKGNWETFYKAKPGYYLIELDVLVHSLFPDRPTSYTWKYVYIVEESGDAWYPSWANSRVVEPGTRIDPSTIGLSSTQIVANDVLDIKQDTYLRLIYGVSDDPDQVILFYLGDSQPIKFTAGRP